MNINRVYHAILREDLYSFIAKSFCTVNPGVKYLPNWHIELIAHTLCEVAAGKIPRLIINMPPRYLKSLCVSVAWPAWLLGRAPHTRVIVASYSQALSVKHSLDCRLLVASDWYQKLFPQTILADDQNTKHKFSTTQRGFRFATSIGGTVTGEGGEFLIVDDPHNPQQANSPLMRKKSIDWFEQSFISRLDNKKTGAIVIIMQRLHENDLTGHLLNKKNSLWQSLTIPAIATHDTTFTNNISRNEGNVLHLARESFEQLMQTQAEIGSYAFAAQYQQSPITIEGAMVKPKWIQRYDEIPQEIIKIVQSWDTAIKTNTNNDYSVVTTWAETRAGYHLLEVKRAKMEYPELKKFSTAYGIKWGAAAILIEDKASGQSLIQDLKRETNLPIIAVKPSKDKVTRFATVTPLFEAGKIFLPRCAPWLAEYENELLSFPSSTSDDQIDSTSQFLNWSRNNNYQGSRIRVI